MAIRVTRSDEAIKIDTVCFTIYSQPGLGKTSLAFTAPQASASRLRQGRAPRR